MKSPDCVNNRPLSSARAKKPLGGRAAKCETAWPHRRVLRGLDCSLDFVECRSFHVEGANRHFFQQGRDLAADECLVLLASIECMVRRRSTRELGATRTVCENVSGLLVENALRAHDDDARVPVLVNPDGRE